MKVFLLPHHPLDPRFRYTLEREAPSQEMPEAPIAKPTLVQRLFNRLRQWYRRLKLDYDQVVHGHEQIRLSRLVLMMDRDPALTLVVPAGMSRDCALQAVRGVIRSGLMALRSHAIRNIITAVVMMVVLFGATPTHVGAVIFYPLIALYAWGRYWEDQLIRRRMTHLLEVGLAENGRERFREERRLAWLDDKFRQTPSVELAYREAVHYLDSHDGEQDGLATPEQALLLRYYSDIGRFDPYERYQDRIRKKLGDTARLVVRHLWEFWRAAFYWSFSTSRIVGLRIPNLLFVMLGTLALGYATIWYSSWTSRESSSLPRSVRAIVDFSHGAKVTVEAKLPGTDLAHRPAASSPPTLGQIFNLTCPLDDGNISLLSVITEMIRKRSKHSSGTITCPGGEEGVAHQASYEVRIHF